MSPVLSLHQWSLLVRSGAGPRLQGCRQAGETQAGVQWEISWPSHGTTDWFWVDDYIHLLLHMDEDEGREGGREFKSIIWFLWGKKYTKRAFH